MTPGIVKRSGTNEANLPPSRGSSVKKTSAPKRKQKENKVQDDSKRPPWRPSSASKTLFSQPLTRCRNLNLKPKLRKLKDYVEENQPEMAGDVGQDMGHAGQDMGQATDNIVTFPHRPSAMDLPETAGPANTAVTHEETDLENRSDGREDENDSDMMGAAAAAPKKTSMRQELHVEQSRLKEKGKTPSPRFNHILTFRTPSPGSAARRFNSILALRTPSPDHVRPSALFNTPKRRSTFNSQTLRRSRRLAMVARGDAGPTLCLELPCVSPPFASHDPLGAISR
ncbi:uncharacterized protein [Branchiostoma lanceolatum]